jgi:hypothetical protein
MAGSAMLMRETAKDRSRRAEALAECHYGILPFRTCEYSWSVLDRKIDWNAEKLQRTITDAYKHDPHGLLNEILSLNNTSGRASKMTRLILDEEVRSAKAATSCESIMRTSCAPIGASNLWMDLVFSGCVRGIHAVPSDAASHRGTFISSKT